MAQTLYATAEKAQYGSSKNEIQSFTSELFAPQERLMRLPQLRIPQYAGFSAYAVSSDPLLLSPISAGTKRSSSTLEGGSSDEENIEEDPFSQDNFKPKQKKIKTKGTIASNFRKVKDADSNPTATDEATTAMIKAKHAAIERNSQAKFNGNLQSLGELVFGPLPADSTKKSRNKNDIIDEAHRRLRNMAKLEQETKNLRNENQRLRIELEVAQRSMNQMPQLGVPASTFQNQPQQVYYTQSFHGQHPGQDLYSMPTHHLQAQQAVLMNSFGRQYMLTPYNSNANQAQQFVAVPGDARVSLEQNYFQNQYSPSRVSPMAQKQNQAQNTQTVESTPYGIAQVRQQPNNLQYQNIRPSPAQVSQRQGIVRDQPVIPSPARPAQASQQKFNGQHQPVLPANTPIPQQQVNGKNQSIVLSARPGIIRPEQQNQAQLADIAPHPFGQFQSQAQVQPDNIFIPSAAVVQQVNFVLSEADAQQMASGNYIKLDEQQIPQPAPEVEVRQQPQQNEPVVDALEIASPDVNTFDHDQLDQDARDLFEQSLGASREDEDWTSMYLDHQASFLDHSV